MDMAIILRRAAQLRFYVVASLEVGPAIGMLAGRSLDSHA
jgi:hypothetical protein